MNKTGGGEAIKIKDDPIYNLTLDIINKKTVFGLKNNFDGDRDLTDNYNSDVENKQKLESLYEFDGEHHRTDEENEVTVVQMEEEDSLQKDMMCDTHETVKSTTEALQTPSMKKSKPNRTNTSNDWHSRRRPQVSKMGNIAVRYEEVADLKKEVMKSQLNILHLQQKEVEEKNEWETKYRQLRERREKEEYELKKKSLELDIEIKKAQLIALHSLNETG